MDLSTHVDDADVTLNVCLGKEFTGGTLYFHGIRGTPTEKTDYFEFTHKTGKIDCQMRKSRSLQELL